MDITARALWSLLHGIGFGALYLLACSGALVELARRYSPSAAAALTAADESFLRVYLVVMAALAWFTVLTGAYIVYPWYRAIPPAGANLASYPQRLLLASPATSDWHSIGMEWKEHVAWLVPIATTMAAAIVARYGRRLAALPTLRNAVLGFLAAAFLAAAIAGLSGAIINKAAPITGGSTIHLIHGA
ncbi:MAG: hypothetical protein WCA37_04385 [Terracidiphilus sp.]